MKRTREWVGWIVVMILMPSYLYSLPKAYGDDLDYGRGIWAAAEPIVGVIRPLCDGVCYGQYFRHHWLNFASGEELCVAGLPYERYAPYARKAELADHPAVLDDYYGLHAFLRYSGGQSRETDVAGIHVDYDLTPPTNAWRYLEDSAITEVKDDKGNSFRKELTDNTLQTAWATVLKQDAPAELAAEFDRPHSLCGVRFVSREGSPPGYIALEAQCPGSTNWHTILPWTAPCGYFWSGSHLKFEGLQTFEEIRWACPTGGVARLRMKIGAADSRPQTVSLDEILFLEQAPPPEGNLPTLDECLTVLRDHHVRQFFGPRWMTERLASRASGEMSCATPSFVSRTVQDLPVIDPSKAVKVYFHETAGLLMDSRDAPRTRAVLGKCGQQWKELKLGSLTLMVVSEATDEGDGIRRTPVYWTEQGCFAEESSRTLKGRAELVFQEALARKAKGAVGGVIDTLSRVLSLYEWHQPARRELAESLRLSGRLAEAEVQERILSRQVQPEVSAAVQFPGGIRLIGIRLSTNEVTPGKSFEVTYYWTCPTSVRTPLYNAFVNFQKGKDRFQDDHILIGDRPAENIEYQPFPEIYSYTRLVTVPASATPGDYKVVIGVVNRVNKERLKPDTRLRVSKRGVEIPVVVKILPVTPEVPKSSETTNSDTQTHTVYTQ